jgi:hypothetical protein
MRDLSIQNIAELISLGMTFPTVVLAGAVVYMWFPAARIAWSKENKTGQDWFIVGVTVGFIGAMLDNIYWFIPWSASYIGHPSFAELTNAGVFFNVFFRQGLGMLAAYCHLRAAENAERKRIRWVNSTLLASNLAGVAYAALLILGVNT